MACNTVLPRCEKYMSERVVRKMLPLFSKLLIKHVTIHQTFAVSKVVSKVVT